MANYKATKTRTQKRHGWNVTFRHPFRLTGAGKPVRIHKGLATTDEAEANDLVGQLNTLLEDDKYHNPAAREVAARTFDARVVRLFFEDATLKADDPWGIRESVLPLPTRTDDYSRILLLGPTGAGKTTLLRQMIGSDRFPSTSTSRTTVFDTEIIIRAGRYEAVVVFLPRQQVRFYVEECLMAAVCAHAEGAKGTEVTRRFLEHSEQRFRLSYVLGSLREPGPELDDDDDCSEDSAPPESSLITEEERKEIEARLIDFLGRIREIGDRLRKDLAEELGEKFDLLKPADRDAFQELLEERLREEEDAQSLIDEIVEEIEARFDILDPQCCVRPNAKESWPSYWSYSSDDQEDLIKKVLQFSSNNAVNFGRLLTPVVLGMRVAGPFRAEWDMGHRNRKFVFMDGEGLGHTPSSATSLPTQVTKRYDSADVILLIDNATQSMLAASHAVLRSVGASGHQSKLCIVFTHMDRMEGPNFPDFSSKRNHVQGTLDNALDSMETALGPTAANDLKRSVPGRVFFLSGIDEAVADGKATRRGMSNLQKVFEDAIAPVAPVEAIPVYDTGNLVLCMEGATKEFHKKWGARLGLGPVEGQQAVHWAKVKALSRRFAYSISDGYDNLRPVAELIELSQERLTEFISNPRSWTHPPRDDQERQIAINRVKQEVFSRFHRVFAERVADQQLKDWEVAYGYRGFGSTFDRAREIRNIYEDAAPIPMERPTPQTTQFLDVVRDLFKSAAEAAGARVM